MAEVAFELEYDGPALAAHEMDVRELAPALISTADLFQEMNRRLHPVAPPLAVTVRATSEGSFYGDDATAVSNLLDMLTADPRGGPLRAA